MTDIQLYFAVGIPTLAVLVSFVTNLFTVFGIRGEIAAIRSDQRGPRRYRRDSLGDHVLSGSYRHN